MDTPSTGVPKPPRLRTTPADPFVAAASWDLYAAGQHIIDAIDHGDRSDFDSAVGEMRSALTKAKRRL